VPRPLGRDRLEPTNDESIVLLSLRPKPWVGREEVSPRAPVLLGWFFPFRVMGEGISFLVHELGHTLVAFTEAHVTAFDLGGHLAEVVFAAWAFRRAVRGERPEWERPVWAFFAFYLVARNVKLFGGVALSSAARTDYLTIAFTGQNDMVEVAATTGPALTTIAALTALVFLVVPLGTLVLSLRGPENDEA